MLIRREAVTPDAVLGPAAWPVPYEGDDDPGDHDPHCDGCVWCDQDHWRYAYAGIHKAHDRLVGSVRAMADELASSTTPGERAIGKALRTLVRDAEYARQTTPRPRPDPC